MLAVRREAHSDAALNVSGVCRTCVAVLLLRCGECAGGRDIAREEGRGGGLGHSRGVCGGQVSWFETGKVGG